MNRSGVRQKRSIGKASPLAKRPKLDFNLRSRDSPNGSKNTSSNGLSDKSLKDTSTGVNPVGGKVNGNVSSEPDWDDDFSGDMLEKVCLIADLSQAMVNNQAPAEKIEKTKVQLFKDNKLSSSLDTGEVQRLRMELQELQERFKTKEGEVHILRSQLKQNEDTKQAAALQNIKVIEDIHKKYNEKLSVTEKELETFKTKLQFKDMEYKTLSERCRQLEYCISKNKLNDLQASQVDTTKHFGGFSQALSQKNKAGESECGGRSAEKSFSDTMECDNSTHHEGRYLEKCLCPEIFELAEEPSVIHFYTARSGIKTHDKSKLDFDRREEYKWHDLPKQTVFLNDLYEPLSSLFIHESFKQRDAKRKVETILDACEKILIHNKEVLMFLDKLQLQNYECDNSDQSLLDNENEIKVLTSRDLLNGKRLSEEECGIEGKRTLGLVSALMETSQVASQVVKSRTHFVEILKLLAEAIGNLRRPLRYTGILCGISFVLKRLLLQETLNKSVVKIINETVEEIIFSRPKLDVLTEVVNVLAAGRNHFEFLLALCRKASLESCSLYVDSKLKQAMFFTKNACPLKLLCMQIMGSACLPSSRNIRWPLTDAVIRWLNNSINTRDNKKLKWLPTTILSDEDERCFEVTECLLYLLTLCLKDYSGWLSAGSGSAGDRGGHARSMTDSAGRPNCPISVIGHGAVLLKRILKTDQRQLHDNSYSLRFANLLNSLMIGKSENSCVHQGLSAVQMEAITWLTDSLEGDLRNQDCYLRQSTSAMSASDILSALKIADESKIY